MGIAMKEIGERCSPVVVCDECRQVIARAEEGMVVWPGVDGVDSGADAAVRRVTEVLFFHKKRCAAAPSRLPPAQHAEVSWIELSVLPLRLKLSLELCDLGIAAAALYSVPFGEGRE